MRFCVVGHQHYGENAGQGRWRRLYYRAHTLLVTALSSAHRPALHFAAMAGHAASIPNNALEPVTADLAEGRRTMQFRA